MPYHEDLSSEHGQCNSIIFLKTFSLESSKQLLLNFCLADSRILYFWQVLESLHKLINELHILQCLFVRGSSKKQRRDRVFQISQKQRLFHLLYRPSALGDNVLMRPHFTCTLPKRSFFTLQLGKEDNLSGNSIKKRVDWFILKIAKVLPVPTGRVEIGRWKLL